MARRLLLLGLLAVATNAFPRLNEAEELMRQATKCIKAGDPQKKYVRISSNDLFHQALRYKDSDGWLSTQIDNVTTQKNPMIIWKLDLARLAKLPHNKTYWIESGHRAGSCGMEVSMALMCATIKYCKKYDQLKKKGPMSKVCRTRINFVHQSNPDGYDYNLKQEDGSKTDFTETNLQKKFANCDGIFINQNFKEGFVKDDAKCTGDAPYEAPEAKYLNSETKKHNPCGHFTFVENKDKFRFLAPWASKDEAVTDKGYKRRAHIIRKEFNMETGGYFSRAGIKRGTHLDTFHQETSADKKKFSQLLQCKKGYDRQKLEDITKAFVHVLASGIKRPKKSPEDNKATYDEIGNANPTTEFTPEETEDAVDVALEGPYKNKFTQDDSLPETSQGLSQRVLTADNTKIPNARGKSKNKPIVSVFGGGLINQILEKYAGNRNYEFKMHFMSSYNQNNGYYTNKNADIVQGQQCASVEEDGYNILMGFKNEPSITNKCDKLWSQENAAQETKNMKALIEDSSLKMKMQKGGGVFIVFTFMDDGPSTIHHTAKSKAHADQLKTAMAPVLEGLAIKAGFDKVSNIDAITQDVIIVKINYKNANNKSFKEIADGFLAGLKAAFPKK